MGSDLPRRLARLLWRPIQGILSWALALLLLFEEWGWEPLARTLARIGRWPGFRWIEQWIRSLPPYGALALFGLPILALLPVKLLALYWLSNGHRLLGLCVIVAAKVGGTAITARLFMLTQDTLMRMPWFARWFTRWVQWKDALLARVQHSAAWQNLAHIRQHLAARMRAAVQTVRRWLGR